MQTAPDALFKSLADPTRRALFERLSRDGEQTVRISQVVVGTDPPVTIRDFDDGQLTCYSYDGSPLQVFDLGQPAKRHRGTNPKETDNGAKRRLQSADD